MCIRGRGQRPRTGDRADDAEGALENGFTPSSTFLSERTTFNLGDSTYSPKNANNRYANKNISMLSAISYSDNIYAMKTHLFLGTDLLSKTMKRVGVPYGRFKTILCSDV